MTVSFKTFGCRLNRAETERFEAEFAASGVSCVPFGEPSDIVVIHTCAVTSTAESECLRLARQVRTRRQDALLVLSGCGVESVPQERLAQLGMDLIVRRADRDHLVRLVLGMQAAGIRFPSGIAAPCPKTARTCGRQDGPGRKAASSRCNGYFPCPALQRALLKVQDGCSCFCTYCIVPYTRGAPVSRPFRECLDEAKMFIDRGFQEIVVVGCNLALYSDGGKKLPDLLAALTSLPGVGRIRLSSLEPGVCEREVAELMASTKKICAFLHLPLQSGDGDVLKRMGRHYSVEDVRRTLDMVVSKVPMLGLGADLITGFPGETGEMFLHTRRLVEEYPFGNLHVFPYSERPGTPAASFPDKVPVPERKRRANDLIVLREEKKRAFALRHVGQLVEVLVEGIDENGVGHGWTADYVECRIDGLVSGSAGKLVETVPSCADGAVLSAGARLPVGLP